ncbi:MAG: hypothetical protein Fur0035_16690 [Anaerolineales bacterium]
MPALISLGILVFTFAALGGLFLAQPRSAFAWPLAALGALAAWASVFFWQLKIPLLLPVASWAPVTLFAVSPALKMDSLAWLYSLSLTGLAAAVILSSPARAAGVSPVAWLGTLALTALGLLAFLADNPLTLVMIWTALDLAEFANSLRAANSAADSERVVVAFSLRALGTGFALWASVSSAATGATFLFESLRPQSAIFLLLAVGLRLGVLPLHLTYRAEPQMRRGFGTLLRLTVAASGLVVLGRIPHSAISGGAALMAQALILLAALYGGWKWLTGAEALSARPYWLIGMSALALAAAFRDNPLGAAAWGNALILLGGLIFLASHRLRWLNILLGLTALTALGLPFSLTASGWQGEMAWFFWPPALAAQVMLLAGFARYFFGLPAGRWDELSPGARGAYRLGLGLLAALALQAGFWGWPGALQLGAWGAGLAALALAGLILALALRFPALLQISFPARVSSLFRAQDFFAGLLWQGYRLLRQLADFLSALLEGDGGLLWTLVLLALFILFWQGR